MNVHLLGIRHHGPGSARHLRNFLERVRPDILLVEGPPEAEAILSWAVHADMQPPVAILTYSPDDLEQAGFYPFAVFSPEWQAITYGISNNIPVRFFDLPLTHKFAIRAVAEKKQREQPAGEKKEKPEAPEAPSEEELLHLLDPLAPLAQAAGFSDGERWWENMFEHRSGSEDVFTAVQEAMTALRESAPERDDQIEKLREAEMRQQVRRAKKENFKNIAVICGAWHVPAIAADIPETDDEVLLRGLPKMKVEATWVPWTYDRLSFESGYGAGIFSPGWYEHVWKHPGDNGVLWMTRVAQLFRSKQMDTSTAHVIEAVRLSEAVAALRGFSRPGLDEMNEAALAVLCNGDEVLLQLIRRELIVDNVIGHVPGEVPRPPLQVDIERQQRKLRLPPSAEEKEYIFDLREENDLKRSVLLHRLQLLGVQWGKKGRARGKGTFKENWTLKWEPEFSIHIIEKGSWGNTAEEAASGFVRDFAARATELRVVVNLLESSLPADLPGVTELLMQRINNLAAATGDVLQLMESMPGLVNVSRYGNVRKTDTAQLMGIVKAMIARICISLPSACSSIDEEAARKMLDLFYTLHNAVLLLEEEEQTEQWKKTLEILSSGMNIAAAVAGYATRLLHDFGSLGREQLNARFSAALSKAVEPLTAANWLEGFLKGTGTILLIDDGLWQLINGWVKQLEEENFISVLPMLRRTFSEFTPAERRKIGEKARGGNRTAMQADAAFDEERAATALPVVLDLLRMK